LDIERNLAEKTRDIISYYLNSSIISPTTFYNSICHEMSGNGYENGIAFFKYLVDLKLKFCDYIKSKIFYSEDKNVEPFIKSGEEIVFYANVKIPGNFFAGMILLGFLTITFIIFSYFLVKDAVLNMRSVDILDVKFDAESLDLIKGKHVVYQSSDHRPKDILYCLLSGRNQELTKKGFNGRVIVNGVNIASEKNNEAFTYICPPGDLPKDSRVIDFFNFIARRFKISMKQRNEIMDIHGLEGLKNKLIGNIKDRQRGDIVLAMARLIPVKENGIYLFYNTTMGLCSKFASIFKDLIMDLTQKNAAVIYLADNLKVKSLEGKNGQSLFFWKDWTDWIDDYRD
jgi:hypothetical protein